MPTGDLRLVLVITGPLITGPLMTGPLMAGPPESPELPELTDIMEGAVVIFLCSEAGDVGMDQLCRQTVKKTHAKTEGGSRCASSS